MRTAVVGLVVVLLVLGVSGCTRKPPRGIAEGTVTLNGQPLEGTIEFIPADGKGQTAAGFIKEGRYKVEASVGEMKVVIYSALKEIGQRKAYDTPDSPSVAVYDTTKQLPARFNTSTELKATIQAGATVQANFDLKVDKNERAPNFGF